MKLSAKAKALFKDPMFHEELLSELTDALWKESLGLTDEQSEGLSELIAALSRTLSENAEELAGLEKFELRQELLHELFGGMEDTLTDDQLQRWEAVRDYSESIFRYGQRTTVGLSSTSEASLKNLASNTFGVKWNDVGESLLDVTASYVKEAGNVLKRFATTNEELTALTPEQRYSLELEMFRLQSRFYEQALPSLTDGQRERVRLKEPTIFRFQFGNVSGMNGNIYRF